MRPILYIPLVLLLLLALPACHTRLRGGAGDFSITSLDERTSFEPTFTTAAYFPVDPSTADVYLSDLPAARLADPNDNLQGASGSIVQIHLFLIPSAGNTPIDSTACNVTIRHLILAGPADRPRDRSIGLYGGGGFVFPWGDIGDPRISGSIDHATHRLLRASPAFTDLLGPGAVSGSFTAARNDALARTIAAKFDALSRKLPERDTNAEAKAAPK